MIVNAEARITELEATCEKQGKRIAELKEEVTVTTMLAAIHLSGKRRFYERTEAAEAKIAELEEQLEEALANAEAGAHQADQERMRAEEAEVKAAEMEEEVSVLNGCMKGVQDMHQSTLERLRKETETSGHWFAWHVRAAEEENEIIEALTERAETAKAKLAGLEEERDSLNLLLNILKIESGLKKCDCCGYQRIFFYIAHKKGFNECAWCLVEKAEAELAKLRESKDLCPVCLTWSWASCDEGDEGAQLRGEKWVLCQCCNDSRIAVLWKGRAEELRKAGQTVVDADEGEDFQSESVWREKLTKAISTLEAALAKGDEK